MKIFAFENLEVWKESRKFVVTVYELQATFPGFEKYGLGDQLRRAVISVSSNIAEGNARYSRKEQKHFIEIAIGSLMEVYNQLILAYDLRYITEEQLKECNHYTASIFNMLNALRLKKLREIQ